MVEALDKAGVAIVLLKQNFDTGTPQGRFALTMFAAMAELEAATIAERLAEGRVQKARQGGRPGATVPFGYDLASGTFTPNADAKTVKLAFRYYLLGGAINKIADALNAHGRRTATGKRWYASTVPYVLHNGFDAVPAKGAWAVFFAQI